MPLVPSPRSARALPALALFLVPCLATADIAPPPRNEGCSVELLERTGLECLVPEFGPYRDLWTQRGFEPRCDLYRPYRGGGSAEPGSVWCRSPLGTSRAERAAAEAGSPAGFAAASTPAPRSPSPRAEALAAVAKGAGAFAELLRAAASRWTPRQNVAVSPLAVWTALATASGVARGMTASELRRGLALEGSAGEAVAAARALGDEVHRRNSSFIVSTAWFLDDARSPSPELQALAAAAGARLEPADLQRFPGDTVLRLDGWAGRETRGRLGQLVPPRSLYRSTRVVIASVSGLVAAWPEAFAPAAPVAFYVASRSTGRRWGRVDQRTPAELKDVQAVRATGSFAIASLDGVIGAPGPGSGAIVVDVPLAGGLALTLVVPHAVADSPGHLRVALPELLARLRPRRVELTVPVFAVEAPPTSLGDALAGVGPATPFRDAFDARDGDVSGIAVGGGDRLVLGELFHRAYLELGAAGAGVGPAPGRAVASGEPARPIAVDNPFLFIVRDVASGVVLLAGTVKDPAPAQPARVSDVIVQTLGPVARAGSPQVSAGVTRVEGRLRREQVREALGFHLEEVASCYGQQLVLDPALRGTIAMRWTVGTGGDVRDVKVVRAGTSLASEDLRACLAGRIARWSFAEPGPGTVEQAWTLRPPRADRAPAVGPVQSAHRYAFQPGERCRPAGVQEGLGRATSPDADRPLPRAADLEITGPLDEPLVRKVLDAHAAEIRRAYEQRLAQDRRLQGTVAIEWVVDRDGRAHSPRVDCNATTLDDTFVFEAMKVRIQTWTFPKPRGGATTVVNHRWTFVPLSFPGPR